MKWEKTVFDLDAVAPPLLASRERRAVNGEPLSTKAAIRKFSVFSSFFGKFLPFFSGGKIISARPQILSGRAKPAHAKAPREAFALCLGESTNPDNQARQWSLPVGG